MKAARELKQDKATAETEAETEQKADNCEGSSTGDVLEVAKPTTPNTGRPQAGSLRKSVKTVGGDSDERYTTWHKIFSGLSDKANNETSLAKLATLATSIEAIFLQLPAVCQQVPIDEGEVKKAIYSNLLPNTDGNHVDGTSGCSTCVPPEESGPTIDSNETIARERHRDSINVFARSLSFSGKCAGGASSVLALRSDVLVENETESDSGDEAAMFVCKSISTKQAALGTIVTTKQGMAIEHRGKASVCYTQMQQKHPLYDAMVLMKGHSQEIQRLFKTGDVVDLEASLDRLVPLPTPLFYAVVPLQSVGICELLLQQKAHLDTKLVTPEAWHGIEPGMDAVQAVRALKKIGSENMDIKTLTRIDDLFHRNLEAQKILMNHGLDRNDTTVETKDNHSNAFFYRHIDGHPSKFYEIEEEVGCGSFGSVRLARLKKSNVIHAVKIIPKALQPEGDVWNEIDIMKQVDHPHVSRLYSTYQDEKNIYVATEMCAGGELFDAIIATQRMTSNIAARLFRQALSAITYIHYKNICHRDIKPENYLLSKKGDLGETHVKLIDFGTAKRFDLEPMTTKVCTVHYVAPEVLKRNMEPYTEKVDVWSLGVMLYMMLSGLPPFDANDDVSLMKKVKKGKWEFAPDRVWNGIAPDGKDLLTSMLCVKVDLRMSALEATRSAWLELEADDRSTIAPTLSESTMGVMRKFVVTSKLKKLALQVIARQVSDESIQKMRDLFQFIDVDNSGSITFQELDEGLERLDVDLATRAEITRVMCDIDIDGNGTIDYTEFIAATINKQIYMKEEVCRATFGMFDMNGDGVVCQQDLHKMLLQIQNGETTGPIGIAVEDVEQIMKEADANGDGKLEFREFMALMADDVLSKITCAN